MSGWADTARAVIRRVHMSLPETATLDERIAAVDASYPFGEKAMHPYKMWTKARREYLCRHGYQPKGKRIVESPLERLMRRSPLTTIPPPASEGERDG